MRHGKRFNHLGRKAGHRRALMSNLASSLIEHKRINTTLAKGKALRQYVEPIITKSKNDTTHNRRTVFSYLQNKEAVKELFREVAPKVADRPGGYVRIIKTGFRLGDNAEMCMVELVDFNELYKNEKAGQSKKRRRRSGGKKTAEAAVETAVAEEVVEAPEATESAETTEEPKAEEKKEDESTDDNKEA